jgi:hypothetical protein
VPDHANRRSLAATLKGFLRLFPGIYRPTRAARRWVDRNVVVPISQRREIAQWRRSGSPVPPPEPFKQATVRAYGRAFRLPTLVETGTYLGEMVEAQRWRFRRVWSIELSSDLFAAALARFAEAPNVTLLEGDSGDLMPAVLERLDGPALFWLDGHYSAGVTVRGSLDTPVKRELEAILGSAASHVILVDDARCFGTGDYPPLEEVQNLVARLRPGWTCLVRDDIIRICPRSERSVADSSPRPLE